MSEWLGQLNSGAAHLKNIILPWLGILVGAAVVLAVLVWLIGSVIKYRRRIASGVVSMFKTLGSAAGGLKAGTAAGKLGISILGLLAAVSGIFLVASCGVNPVAWFTRGSGWGWFSLTLLVTSGVVYYGIGSAKSWGTKLVGFFALSCAIVVVGGFIKDSAAPAMARSPLVPESIAHDSTAIAYPFDIPRKLGDVTLEWNGRELRIPAHSTVELRAVGRMDFDPDRSRQSTLAWGYRRFMAKGEVEKARQVELFTSTSPVMIVTPDSGSMYPSVFRGQAKHFPLPNSPFGRPYYRLGSNPPEPLTGRFVPVTNSTNRDLVLKVGLNIDPRTLNTNKLDSWLWAPEGKFTLHVRGIKLPV